MKDTLFMPNLPIADMTFELKRPTRVVRSAEGGSFQREARAGQARWVATVTWEPLEGEDRRELERWIAEVDRGDRWAFVWWPFTRRGDEAWRFDNRIKGGTFDDASALDHWGNGPTGARHFIDGRRLRMDNKNNLNDSSEARQLVSGSSSAFFLRFSFVPGFNDRARAMVRRESDGSNIFNPDVQEGARLFNYRTPFLSSSEDYYIRLRQNVTGSEGSLNWGLYDDVQFSICGKVDGGSQSGNSLNVRSLPGDKRGLALAGEFVEIFTEDSSSKSLSNSELKRLIADVDTDGSEAVLRFEPALKKSPESGAPAVFHKPGFRAVLSGESRRRRYTQPDYVQITQSFEEDIDA